MIITILTVLIVYILYYIVSISRFDKIGHAKKEGVSDYQALPSEVKYFVWKYKVDEEKVNYRGVLKLIGLTLGIDIALIIIPVVLLIKNEILQIVVSVVLLFPVYLISLKIIGNYFKKKGLVKDENK